MFTNGRLSLLVAAIVAMVVLAGGSAVAQEKKKAAPDIPAAIHDAFMKSYPNAKILSCAKEREKGKTVYEVESMDGDQRRDLLYTPDGTAIEIEEIVRVEALPAAVKAAYDAEYGKHKIEKAEKVTRGETVVYEITAKSGKKHFEVVIGSDGKIEKGKAAKKEKEEKKEKGEEDEESEKN